MLHRTVIYKCLDLKQRNILLKFCVVAGDGYPKSERILQPTVKTSVSSLCLVFSIFASSFRNRLHSVAPPCVYAITCLTPSAATAISSPGLHLLDFTPSVSTVPSLLLQSPLFSPPCITEYSVRLPLTSAPLFQRSAPARTPPGRDV